MNWRLVKPRAARARFDFVSSILGEITSRDPVAADDRHRKARFHPVGMRRTCPLEAILHRCSLTASIAVTEIAPAGKPNRESA
jgi:hypothetical protein